MSYWDTSSLVKLFTVESDSADYRNHAATVADGLVTAHIGSPFYHPERFAKTLADLRSVFPQVAAYKAFMPIYGAEWGMACASMQTDPRTLNAAEISGRLTACAISDLRFYTPRVHASLFAWPAYAERLGA